MERCSFCRSEKFKKLFETFDNPILQCMRCGLVRTGGFKLPKYQEYHRDDDYLKYESHFRNIFEKRFKLISKYKNSGRVLEIGASSGTMLDLFLKHGWITYGVEPSGAGKFAKAKGHRILRNEFEKANLKANFFDVVILNHTLEHMMNPLSVLRKVRRILKKGGVVYIDVPNFASFSAIVSREWWKYLLPSEHIHHFTNRSLLKIINKAGLRKVKVMTWSGFFDFANPFLYYWWSFTSGRINFINDFIDIPGNFVATLLNRGTNLVIIAQKRK